MNENTAQTISLALKDASVTQEERDAIMRIIKGEAIKPQQGVLPHIVSRSELARLTHRSVKSVDRFARDNSSILQRVFAPGASRSIGFTQESVARFLTGRCGN